MKYVYLFFVVIILGSVAYSYFASDDEPATFKIALLRQANPFTSKKDSTEIIWARAKQFIDVRKGLIGGGDLEVSDSAYYIPYYNDHHKGGSVRIVRRSVGDSVLYFVQYWYSEKPAEKAAKEIALFMQQNISKYNSR